MASHKFLLIVMVLIAIGVIYGVNMGPKITTSNGIALTDSKDVDFEGRLENILTEFHELLNKRLETQIGLEEAEKGLESINSFIGEGKSDAELERNRVSLLDQNDGITGNVIGLDNYENTLSIYEQILAKTSELSRLLEGYIQYKLSLLDYDAISTDFITQKGKLEQQLSERENEKALETINAMILITEKQIDIVNTMMENSVVNIPETGMFLNDRVYYQKFLVSFRNDVQKVVDDPTIQQDVALVESEAAFKEYMTNAFTPAQLAQAHKRWYDINILPRFKEIQDMVVEYSDSKRSLSLATS